MNGLDTMRRKGATAALRGFRALPGTLRRGLVLSGTPHYTVGAVCVIEHEDQALVLSQPHRSGWSLPGGLLGRGETPQEAVVREVLEETGLRIEPGDPVATGVNPQTHSVDVVFRVRSSRRPQVHPSREARRHRWLRLAELEDADEATRQILATVRGADRQAAPGRILQGASAADGDPPPAA